MSGWCTAALPSVAPIQMPCFPFFSVFIWAKRILNAISIAVPRLHLRNILLTFDLKKKKMTCSVLYRVTKRSLHPLTWAIGLCLARNQKVWFASGPSITPTPHPSSNYHRPSRMRKKKEKKSFSHVHGRGHDRDLLCHGLHDHRGRLCQPPSSPCSWAWARRR